MFGWPDPPPASHGSFVAPIAFGGAHRTGTLWEFPEVTRSPQSSLPSKCESKAQAEREPRPQGTTGFQGGGGAHSLGLSVFDGWMVNEKMNFAQDQIQQKGERWMKEIKT